MTGAAQALRAERHTIEAAWEKQVLADVPELTVLPRTMLTDHLPEFIEGLSAWLEGNEQDGFRALADGHAMSRQRAGIPIEVLLAEYSTLRRVIVDAVVRHIALPTLGLPCGRSTQGWISR